MEEVTDIKQLLEALKWKENEILIRGKVCKDVIRQAKKQLSVSNDEYAGLDSLQALGNIGVLFPLILSAMDAIEGIFSKGSKEMLALEKNLRIYTLSQIDEEQIILQLRQDSY